MQFAETFATRTARSSELLRTAMRSAPGGAHSTARTVGGGWRPHPPFAAGGEGAHRDPGHGAGGGARPAGVVRQWTDHAWRDARAGAHADMFRAFWEEMMLRGMLFHPSPLQTLFLSTAHRHEHVAATLAALDDAMPAPRARAAELGIAR